VKARLNYFLIIPLLICVAYGLPVIAQQPFYKEYTVENGAPSNEIYSILKDKDDYIWIGCDAGVYRFNGVQFKQYNSPDLKARSASGLCQSPSGRIYGYNFKNQLFYVENGQLLVIDDWKYSINSIAPDNKGNIWISGYNGLFKIREKTLTIEKIISDLHLTDDEGNYIAVNVRYTFDNKIIYHHENYIFELEDEKFVRHEIGSRFKQRPAVVSFSSGFHWIFDSQTGFIMRRTFNGWENYENPALAQLLETRKIASAYDFGDDILWINTFSGLIKLHISSGKIDHYYNSISFSGCTQDFQGNYWFSSLHDGLLKVPDFEILTWNKQSNAFEHEQFSHIAIEKGSLFFSGTTGELININTQTLDVKPIELASKSDFGMLFYDSLQEKLLFNKTSELLEYKHGKITSLGHYRPLKSMWYHPIAGYVICTSQGLFSVEQPIGYQTEVKRIIPEWTRDICHLTPRDLIAVASNSGLYLIDFSRGKFEIIEKLLPDEQILSISFDRRNNLLYALSYNGVVYRVNQNGDVEDFFAHDPEFRSIQIVYSSGYVYLATNKGIVRIAAQDKSVVTLTSFNGLASNNIRCMLIHDNYCWAATGKGIHRIPLKKFNEVLPVGKLILAELLRNNKPETIFQKMTFEYEDNLTLLIDGLAFSSENDFYLAYKFQGYSEKWITVPGISGRIDIPKLPSGEFTLAVKLIDHLGRDSSNRIELPLFVYPPFYGRWWFFALVSCLVAVIIIFFFRIRIAILRKKQRQTLKQLKLENELRLTEQSALKAQMNPHFLFNVLNSIKAFIYENDKKNAAHYLSAFSNLVRNVLELSAQPKVSLQKELDALKTYIELEAMLMQHDFQYLIEITPNVNPAAIEIPALIIQPYVENAFKHGLRHKKGPKELKLTVNYNEENHTIEIQIKDNGVGRVKSQSINLSNPTHHQSFATSAIEKRIRLLNHEQKNIVGVEIIDNFEGETALGTTVIIRIHV
jgi:ligand-binding sensor domain-containing protein/two-component sensor histidine kinase